MENKDKQYALTAEPQQQQALDIFQVPEQAERMIEVMRRIRVVILKVTNVEDWVDQDGKPWLTGYGAEKVARAVGIEWADMKSVKEQYTDDGGQYYFYTYSGKFTLKGQTIEAIGTCSSRDPLLGKRGGQFKVLSEIDECDIRKKSYTNCIVNGITRILGIRNMTWEELEKAGISKNKMNKVSYNKGAKGGNTSTLDEAEIQKKVWEMLLEIAGGSPDDAGAYLENITEFTTNDGKTIRGVKSIKALKGRRLQVIHGKVQAEYKTWSKGLNEATEQRGGSEN